MTVPARLNPNQGGALADRPLAVIDEQAHVELGALKLGDRQLVESFADRGASDRHGIGPI